MLSVRYLVLAACLVIAARVQAEALPKYLTVDYVLSQIDDGHPAVKLAGTGQLVRRLRSCLEPESPLIHTPLPDSGCGYWHFLTARQQAELLVLRRFFDVALADKAAARDNEDMAIAFIDFDRASTRMELGQTSELEVAELETQYQKVRTATFASQAMQRTARSLLAIAMNRPRAFVEEVRLPDMSSLMKWEKPANEQEFYETILKRNTVVSRAGNEFGEEYRQLASDYLRHATLELLLSIDLHQAKRQQADVLRHYRDLNLDRNRTLYEFEVKADLGDSMTMQTAARVEQMEADINLVIAIVILQMLQDKPVGELFNEN
ncbi:MAG: hypothetical protein PVH32_02760 [Chromatiales bacterium]|jgi:hypothetical protein